MVNDKLKLAAIALGHTSTHWHIAAFYPILPYLSKDFALTFSQAGMIIAVRSLVSATANIPAGALADVFRRKRLMMTIAVFWPAAFYLTVALADVYGVILLCSALIGFGNSLWHPPAMSTLSEQFPRKKGFALALLGLFLFSMRPVIFAYALDITPREIGSTTVSFVFGVNQIFSSVSPVIAGFVADRFGLIYIFYLVAIMVLLGFVITLFLPSRTVEMAARQAQNSP